jgi:hypothetical protein
MVFIWEKYECKIIWGMKMVDGMLGPTSYVKFLKRNE